MGRFNMSKKPFEGKKKGKKKTETKKMDKKDQAALSQYNKASWYSDTLFEEENDIALSASPKKNIITGRKH